MANVQVIQRHAHLAGAVKLEFVNGREGKVAKVTDVQASTWQAADTRLWASVVSPFVLVQPEKHAVH